MTRNILTSKGMEHIGPCKEWDIICKNGKVSYEWFVCNCSPYERHYQLQIGKIYYNIKFCPFCGVAINPLTDFIYINNIV
jgi:hypothetical protein